MRKISLGTGILILIAFIFIICGIISKFSGVSLLIPMINNVSNYFTAANTAFLLALVVYKFDRPAE